MLEADGGTSAVDLPGGKFGQLQHKELVDMAERWARHALYWAQAPILTHTLRYEDLKATPIPKASDRAQPILGVDFC